MPPAQDCHTTGILPPATILQAVFGRHALIWTLFVVLLIGWAAGVITGDSFGGGLHLLLLGAIVLLLVETMSNGRRTQG